MKTLTNLEKLKLRMTRIGLGFKSFCCVAFGTLEPSCSSCGDCRGVHHQPTIDEQATAVLIEDAGQVTARYVANVLKRWDGRSHIAIDANRIADLIAKLGNQIAIGAGGRSLLAIQAEAGRVLSMLEAEPLDSETYHDKHCDQLTPTQEPQRQPSSDFLAKYLSGQFVHGPQSFRRN